MSGRFFLDTNILIYAADATEPQKQEIALQRIAVAHGSGKGILSYQVVQEWFNVVLNKGTRKLDRTKALEIYEELIAPLWKIESSRALLDRALELHHRNSLSWWDSLIVSAAVEGGCEKLLTEDLQDGRKIDGLVIENPFR